MVTHAFPFEVAVGFVMAGAGSLRATTELQRPGAQLASLARSAPRPQEEETESRKVEDDADDEMVNAAIGVEHALQPDVFVSRTGHLQVAEGFRCSLPPPYCTSTSTSSLPAGTRLWYSVLGGSSASTEKATDVFLQAGYAPEVNVLKCEADLEAPQAPPSLARSRNGTTMTTTSPNARLGLRRRRKSRLSPASRSPRLSLPHLLPVESTSLRSPALRLSLPVPDRHEMKGRRRLDRCRLARGWFRTSGMARDRGSGGYGTFTRR